MARSRRGRSVSRGLAAALAAAAAFAFSPAVAAAAPEADWPRRALDAPPPGSGALATIGFVDDRVDSRTPGLRHARTVNRAHLSNPHGTMVASVAAGRPTAHVIGVAPGAPVLSFGISDLGCAEVARGITTLARRGARVINVSLEFTQPCRDIRRAVAYAYTRRATVVSVSGNDHELGNRLRFPGSFGHVLTVGAFDAQSGRVADFSRTSQFVDFVAPGVGVPASLPAAFDVRDDARDGLSTLDGTSVAAPLVSGAVSWILGARPHLDPGQVARLLRSTALGVGAPGWDPASGFGIPQIRAALAAPAPPRDMLEPNDEPWMVRPAGSGPFGKPAIWTGGKGRTIHAVGDSADDPLDAYRVVLPPRSRTSVRLTVTSGTVGLYAFGIKARSFYENRDLLARSVRTGGRPETITLRNRSARARTVFVVANTTGPRDGRSESAYRLRIRKG